MLSRGRRHTQLIDCCWFTYLQYFLYRYSYFLWQTNTHTQNLALQLYIHSEYSHWLKTRATLLFESLCLKSWVYVSLITHWSAAASLLATSAIFRRPVETRQQLLWRSSWDTATTLLCRWRHRVTEDFHDDFGIVSDIFTVKMSTTTSFSFKRPKSTNLFIRRYYAMLTVCKTRHELNVYVILNLGLNLQLEKL